MKHTTWDRSEMKEGNFLVSFWVRPPPYTRSFQSRCDLWMRPCRWEAQYDDDLRIADVLHFFCRTWIQDRTRFLSACVAIWPTWNMTHAPRSPKSKRTWSNASRQFKKTSNQIVRNSKGKRKNLEKEDHPVHQNSDELPSRRVGNGEEASAANRVDAQR